jgi:hypothetical protein
MERPYRSQESNLLPISVLRGSTWLGNPAESIARYFLFPTSLLLRY